MSPERKFVPFREIEIVESWIAPSGLMLTNVGAGGATTTNDKTSLVPPEVVTVRS